MIEFKLSIRNIRRDISIYSLLIVSCAIFLALIIGFQSTINSGDLGKLLSADDMTETRMLFKISLWSIACVQYFILFFFYNSYLRFINAIRTRELALYKIIGYSRKSIFKIVLIEGLIAYVLTVIVALILAFICNQVIIHFINSYLNLTTELSTNISLSTALSSFVIYLILILFNSIRTYRKTIVLDLDIALADGEIQKKSRYSSKPYVLVSFGLGVVLLANMTFLSTQAYLSLKYGIVIIALFYAFGLFLIINAICKGYKYLIPKWYKYKGFNTLLVSEINFHINKSKLVILGSIIFMMLSIGALLLSQTITDTLNEAIGAYDYAVQSQLQNHIDDYDGTWSFVANDEPLIIQVYPYELNTDLAKTYQLNMKDNMLLISQDSAAIFNINDGDEVGLKGKDGDEINFEVQITADGFEGAFLPLETVLNNPIFSSFITMEKQLNILEEEVNKGNVQEDTVSTYYYYNTGMDFDIPIISESEYNEYAQMVGCDPISLKEGEIWNDGGDNVLDQTVVGTSNIGLNTVVVPDSFFEMNKDYISDEGDETIYYKVVKPREFNRIDNEIISLKGDAIYSFLEINSISRNEILGTNVFVLLIAIYIAIIFMLCNFISLSINLLSHSIENKKIYTKLDNMGISKSQKGKFVATFVRTFTSIPIIIGTISGLIATNFAIDLLFVYETTYKIDYFSLLKILILYLLINLILINITKFIYKRIIS